MLLFHSCPCRLCSDHVSAHNNLGTLLTGSEAVHHFQMAIKYNPRHYKAFFNLGNTLWYVWQRNEHLISDLFPDKQYDLNQVKID